VPEALHHAEIWMSIFLEFALDALVASIIRDGLGHFPLRDHALEAIVRKSRIRHP
jgi:hypothetical protein